MTNELDFNDKRVIVTKAAISAIPYVGGSLASLYTDFKTEKRIKNLEVFYQEISDKLSKLDQSQIHFDENFKSELITLIEKVNEQVEIEFRFSKLNFLKNYMVNILTTSSETRSFDIDLFFIETLSHLTELECEILTALYPINGLVPVKEINKPNTDPFLILGSIGRLKLFGLTSTVTTSFVINGSVDNALNESVCLTDLGKSFVQFCLNDSL